MKSSDKYQIFSPINKKDLIYQIETKFPLHSEIVEGLFSAKSYSLPQVSSFYSNENSDDFEIITTIRDLFSTYFVHTISQEDTLLYKFDPNILKILSDYGKEHFLSIVEDIPTNFIITKIPNNFNFRKNSLYISRDKILGLSAKFSLEDKLILDMGEIVDFYNDLHEGIDEYLELSSKNF